MSESERKSHIPDEKLAELTSEKLQELERERNALSDRLFHSRADGSLGPEELETLEKQLEQHDAATQKLTMYRADMLDDQSNKKT